MNPGWCKKCGAEIYWVPRPDGGWFRPMERLKSHLPQEVQDFIDGRQAMRVEDGVVEPFRFSTILVIHECEPKPEAVEESIQAAVQKPAKAPKVSKKERKRIQRAARAAALQQEIDRIEAEQIVAQRAALREEREQERLNVRKTNMANRHGKFLLIECPFCKAESGEPCHSMSVGMTTSHETYYNTKPHQQRVDWAYGSGRLEDEPLDETYSVFWKELAKDPSVPRQREFRNWLTKTQDIWSEDWPTTSPGE